MANSQGQYDRRVYGKLVDSKDGMTYKENPETTLLDPNPIVTERYSRSGHDRTHPYGKDNVDEDVRPADSRGPRNNSSPYTGPKSQW